MGLRESNKEDLKVYDREAFRQTTFHDSYDKERVSKWKHKQFLSSLEFAVTGLMTAFREERNMKKHLVIALLVLIAGVVFQVSAVEWLFLLTSIFLVFVAEVLNSAVENLVDLICGETFSPFAKNAKDMAAGAVLLCSIYAALVGLVVFVPKVLALLF